MKRHCEIVILLAALTFATGTTEVSAQDSAPGPWQSFLIPDGKTVYDMVNHVTWLADMNLPHKEKFRFDFASCTGSVDDPQPCIWADGAMSYTSALAWVQALNAYVDSNSGTVGYLGHTTWQLPTAPLKASDCSGTGPEPYREGFAFGCDTSALGFLYHTALGFRAPNTAVPIPPNMVGPFRNFQPNLYWSRSRGGSKSKVCHGGIANFSFATGAQGGGCGGDYADVLPMIGSPTPGGTNPLQVKSDGTVYDPETNVTWLVDANLAAHETFGLPRCTPAADENPPEPTPCVALDGSMNYASAEQFIARMNAYVDPNSGMVTGYLHHTDWNLPTLDAKCPTYGCRGVDNPMGNLYYRQLTSPAGTHFVAGTPIVPVADTAVGPFNQLAPFPYWQCLGATIQDACIPLPVLPILPSPNNEPGTNSEWGFSFGTGFQGTERLTATHFVAVYYLGCDLPDQAQCQGPPPYVLPAIAEKGGPVYSIPGTVTEESTITLTAVTGSVCLRADYCTNAAGIVTAAAGNTTPPGQTSSFGEAQPDGSELELNYGALLISIEGVGTRQVFPAAEANGLNNKVPPTSLTASAPTFQELGFPKFSIQDAKIRFIVADTYYADNSGDFLLTLQTPSATDSANTTETVTVRP
jgi:hypothetical protein